MTAPWNPDYLDAQSTGGTPMFLLGWTGDFGDPDNFIGTFFQTVNPQFGSFENRRSSPSSTRPRRRPTRTGTELYQEANRLIADFVPGVPYVHNQPAVAFAEASPGTCRAAEQRELRRGHGGVI